MDDVMEKVITTTTIGDSENGGGLLGPEQSDTFIDYMWDATVLAKQAQTFRMRSTVQEVDTIAIGEHIVRVATEAVDDGMNIRPAFGKISLTLSKLRIDWELSRESLEDGLTGEALEDRIARMIATQAGNDIEDLLINGNTESASWLYKAFDGWRKRAVVDGVVLDAGGGVIDRGVFNKALRSMDRKFMQRRQNLRFYTSAGLIQDWLYSVQLQSNVFVQSEQQMLDGLRTSNVAEGAAGFTAGAPFGVTLQEVPLFADYNVNLAGAGADTVEGTADDTGGFGSDIWLTYPKNLLVGVKRGIEVHREYKPKKDTIEYTVYTRIGSHVENPEAFVVVQNVAYRD